MDPRDFHRVAEQLARGSTAAHWRSATSRAYYAVFNVGVELLGPVVPLSRGAAAHGEVVRVLSNSGDVDVAQAASALGTLHSRRIDADYDLGNRRAESQMTVRTTVAEAKDIIDALDRAFAGPASGPLKKAIQQYWTGVLRRPLLGCAPVP